MPYQAVIGAREADGGTVSLRLRSGLNLDPIPSRHAVDRIQAVTSASAWIPVSG